MATEDDEYWESQHKKSNRPDDTAFKQQRLRAWKPLITVKSTIPLFAIVGVVFLIVGGVLYGSVNSVKEIQVDYTHCMSVQEPNMTCAEFRSNFSFANKACHCRVNFTLPVRYPGTVFMYYKLTNFFQNHRQYIKSRNNEQLRGDLDQNEGCDPIKTANITETGFTNNVVVPCGLVANSLFNDSFSLLSLKSNMNISLSRRNIAWASDQNTKFRNPTDLSEFADYKQPPNWQKPITELDPNDTENNGFQNEDFIVWMRTAALPTFRKLHRRITEGLESGGYELIVDYNFPTSAFGGQKFVVLSTISWLGGRNSFLGIAYLTVGSISLAVALCFLALNSLSGGVWRPRRNETL